MKNEPPNLLNPKKLMNSLKHYLQQQNHSQSSIYQKTRYAKLFTNFLKTENLQPEEVKQAEILAFIEILKSENKSTQLINTILRAVKTYYQYLQQTNPEMKNPAINQQLRGVRKKMPSDILTMEKMEEIYQNYSTETNRQKRNKIMLGLFIYQAITTEELHKLRPEYINLEKGKIIIPGTRKSNQRQLSLHNFQMIPIQEFLNITRVQIIREINKKRPSRKPDKIEIEKINKQLFISTNGSTNLKPTLLSLFREIRKNHPEVKNSKQLRNSTIIHKLKTENLRAVQYFAGHRYISSTERYKLNNIEELKKDIEKYHPLQ